MSSKNYFGGQLNECFCGGDGKEQLGEQELGQKEVMETEGQNGKRAKGKGWQVQLVPCLAEGPARISREVSR